MAGFEWLDILKGVGSLASAGASLYTGKEANKIEKQKLNYQVEQDQADTNRLNQAQANLDSAISSVYSTDEEKKKKKKNTVDLSLAYGTPSTEM